MTREKVLRPCYTLFIIYMSMISDREDKFIAQIFCVSIN